MDISKRELDRESGIDPGNLEERKEIAEMVKKIRVSSEEGGGYSKSDNKYDLISADGGESSSSSSLNS